MLTPCIVAIRSANIEVVVGPWSVPFLLRSQVENSHEVKCTTGCPGRAGVHPLSRQRAGTARSAACSVGRAGRRGVPAVVYFQVSLAMYPLDAPVEYERFVPDSQVTFPDVSFFRYLYVKAVLLGTMTSLLQVGYDAEDSGIASVGFQEPRDGREPTT